MPLPGTSTIKGLESQPELQNLYAPSPSPIPITPSAVKVVNQDRVNVASLESSAEIVGNEIGSVHVDAKDRGTERQENNSIGLYNGINVLDDSKTDGIVDDNQNARICGATIKQKPGRNLQYQTSPSQWSKTDYECGNLADDFLELWPPTPPESCASLDKHDNVKSVLNSVDELPALKESTSKFALIIHVKEAKVKQWNNNGFVDMTLFANVHVGNVTQQTYTDEGCGVHARWDEKLIFPLHPGVFPEKIIVNVRDIGLLVETVIGEGELFILDVYEKGTVNHILPIYGVRGFEGKIRLTITLAKEKIQRSPRDGSQITPIDEHLPSKSPSPKLLPVLVSDNEPDQSEDDQLPSHACSEPSNTPTSRSTNPTTIATTQGTWKRSPSERAKEHTGESGLNTTYMETASKYPQNSTTRTNIYLDIGAHNKPSDTDINSLHEMFPNLSIDVLESVHVSCGMEINATTEALLEVSGMLDP
eukprot:CFRG2893T1